MASAAFRDGESIRDVEAAVAVGVGGSHGGPAKYGPTCQLSHWFFLTLLRRPSPSELAGEEETRGTGKRLIRVVKFRSDGVGLPALALTVVNTLYKLGPRRHFAAGDGERRGEDRGRRPPSAR
jgi:hypothetical protein